MTSPSELRRRRIAAAKRRPRLHLSMDLTIWLFFVWIAAFGDLHPLSLVGAAIVVVLVQWFFPLPNRAGVYRLHFWPFVVLIARFIWDMSRAGVHVSALILFKRPREDAILRIGVRTDVPEYLSILVAMTTLVPGTVVVDVDRKKKFIYLHCLDVEGQGGVEALKAATWAQEARILRAVAPYSVQESAGVMTRRRADSTAKTAKTAKKEA